MADDYDISLIRVLEGLEAVRTRPGMYIGSTGLRGVHHLVYEVLDNSIDEVLAGYCQNIDISINADGSITIVDNGRGIPTEVDIQTGKSYIETILTVLHVGSTRSGNNQPRVNGENHGIGISVVNILSAQLEVKVWQNQNIYTQRFERGIAVSELIITPNQEHQTGTSITFIPDSEIFTQTIQFDFETLANRCRELAFLNAGIQINLTDYRLKILSIDSPKFESYCYAGGLSSYVDYLNTHKQPLHQEIIHFQGKKSQVLVEISFQWCRDTGESNILSFANMFRTVQGGTHVKGLKQAITRSLNIFARQHHQVQLDDENLLQGLTAIVAVMLPNPEFAGCVKHKLANPEIEEIVDSIVFDKMTEYFNSQPNTATAINVAKNL